MPKQLKGMTEDAIEQLVLDFFGKDHTLTSATSLTQNRLHR